MTFPGPRALGRGVVVAAGQAPPPGCEPWPRVVVEGVDAADALHRHWLMREPVVVELAVDAAWLRTHETDEREPWELTPAFSFERERLQFLVWMNNWDCRSGEPVWWWGRKAARLGAEVGGPADVVLADGTPAWVDGGPRQPLDVDPAGRTVVVHRESVDLGRLAPMPQPAAPAADLAPDQVAAVAHDVGPARVIAPAGSGKTRVLTERLRHLLADRGWEPETVAALAYNTRAADEMRERVTGLPARVRTLNSLGLSLCTAVGGRRETVDEPTVRQMLDQLIELPRAPNTDPYVPYLEGLQAIRMGLQDPDEVEVAFDAPGLAELFPRYCGLLDDKRLLDFDGQLYEAVRLLLRNPAARTTVAQHFLVDEFQDLTPVHLLLVRLLAAPAYDVFGVGDDDQVIYGYSGADPEFLIQFDRYFPGAKPYALEVNYRCSPSVVGAAQTLLSYTPRRIAKAVRPAPGREPVDGELAVRRVPDVAEALTAADVLTGWHDEGAAWSDMAALARVNSALLPLQLTFGERGIPSRQPIDVGILSRTGIRAALAYLRIGLDPGAIAMADLTETIRRPSRRISRKVVEMLGRRGTTSVHDVRRLAGRLSGGDVAKLDAYAADLDRVARAAASGDVRTVLRTVRVDIGLESAMDVLDGARREADRSTHTDDLVALEQAAALHPDPATFEAWLRDALSRGGRDRRGDEPGVELSTIHRVKGREWDDVVVFGVHDTLLPHRLATDEAEERRLLHVAITRARRRVVVLADQAAPSPFLDELAGTRSREERRPRRVREPVAKAARSTSTAAAAAPTVEAQVGMLVSVGGHEGTVVDVNEGGVLVSVGRARMSAAFGSEVRVDGRAVRLAAPGSTARRAAVAEALKVWRKETAARDGVPAYVVLNDKDLDGIAERGPRTLAELAACRGIGAARLERYGDELLSVIESAAWP
ncbi:MAG: ATP-dependent DNA helicase UvrD2 [Actinobacteria bacterium]|nr:ATP-dependent DNA helicase UvrD2 [Actinomycetota bacterium]